MYQKKSLWFTMGILVGIGLLLLSSSSRSLSACQATLLCPNLTIVWCETFGPCSHEACYYGFWYVQCECDDTVWNEECWPGSGPRMPKG